MKTALFIGRFQPFHIGHLDVIKQALKENDFLIIGIGSAEDNFLPDNPFTAGERFGMIRETLKNEKISAEKYSIVPIRNINNYALWTKHVSILLPPFETVYTGSPIVKKLFEKEKKYTIKNSKIIHPINATLIRTALLKNADWEKMVPPPVAKILREINGQERMAITTRP
ncbi:nicotinamide-nucleotide adenylyltransferase [Candidatus Peregrinibacteria bacterium]|nr:nicotinamide-nucleotide adenylyltransferase [Candidatus Peregrinibacteria bacterium]